ncbi:MAG: hypothetical protein IPJ28_08125 [Betaproteobacteria bacterium]|nr:hypothetical protein [Betaproteobacteria bacterium]
MEIVIDQPHLIDTLRFRLQAARALPQDDIRLVVGITALVKPGDHDSATLETHIREALARLVKTDWTFTRIERHPDAAGYERVTLRAGARVAAAENWNLPERARKASADGIALNNPEVSYALSSGRVDAAVEGLRLDLLRKATEQAQRMTEASGRNWRVGDVEFGVAGIVQENARRTGKGAYTDENESLELLALLDTPSGITGGERISLAAQVTLKAFTGYRDDPSRPLYVTQEGG